MRIGVDLGGTKIEIICLDENRKTLCRQRVASPQNDYQATISTIVGLVIQVEADLNLQATVGVGIPGSINTRNQQVKNSNSSWINGQYLQRDLEQALSRNVRIENDANCFALSESIDGVAAGHRNVFGVIIGTGCGGGLVINKQVVRGRNGLGGEWGHNPLPYPSVVKAESDNTTVWFDRVARPEQSTIYRHKSKPDYFVLQEALSEYPGPLCYCGKRGCLETWISGTGFANDYWRVNDQQLSAEVIAQQAQESDEKALAALDRYIERLAKSLAQVINTIDPDVFVLGGGMSKVSSLYQKVPQRWDKYIFSDYSSTKLVPALHGDSSGVRGAAFLWG